jgi:CRISPR-associated endonuclease/helicase Cas3
MKKKLFSYKSQSYSHIDKCLSVHLSNVLDIARESLSYKESVNFSENEILKIIEIITICHDLGKTTTFFQDRLNNSESIKSSKTTHSDISALIAFYIAKKLNISHPLIPLLLIKRHHGNLEDYTRLSSIHIKHNNLAQQADSLNKIDIVNIIKSGLEFDFDIKDFSAYLKSEDIYIDIERETTINKYKNNSEAFFEIEYLFSLLIYADKMDAGIDSPELLKEIKKQINQFNMPEAVDIFIKDNFKDSANNAINPIKNAIYNDAITYVFRIDLTKDKIFSINMPTGTGKTLTSLSFALKLKDRYLKERGISSKIIYCLPFTSIIDQNFLVAQNVFKDYQNKTNILLKHHHLSDIKYSINTDNDEYNIGYDKSSLLIESWDSAIIVTTFIQFFYSIISNQNKALKKFHNIANSIVILDEIQSFPYQYWKLIEETFYILSKKFGITFVLTSATQPLIFDQEKIEEVVENKERYFNDNRLDRIELYSFLANPIKIDNFCIILLKDILLNEDKSFLIILNTIKSSQHVYKYIKDNISKDDNDIYYLSTIIIPAHRKEIIKNIKDNGQKRKILISTQVVEAGIDIDFDIVYRDLCPLDSVFQACGRCNRYSLKEYKGIVKLYSIVDKNRKIFANYVYHSIPLDITKNLLENKKVIKEKDFYNLSCEYYARLKKQKSNDKSDEILKAIENLEFSKIDNFKIIENRKNVYDFFIELSKSQREDRVKFLSILNDDSIEQFQKKADLSGIKNRIYNYVVSVSLKNDEIMTFKTSEYEFIKDALYFIPQNKIEKFYKNADIGFNYQEEDGFF